MGTSRTDGDKTASQKAWNVKQSNEAHAAYLAGLAPSPLLESAGTMATLLLQLENTHPSDATYARVMRETYASIQGFQHLHQRMVECYEDGLMKGAARYARLAADTARLVVDQHLELAEAFDAHKAHAVHPDERHASNRTPAR
jgi:hypothetical protein